MSNSAGEESAGYRRTDYLTPALVECGGCGARALNLRPRGLPAECRRCGSRDLREVRSSHRGGTL